MRLASLSVTEANVRAFCIVAPCATLCAVITKAAVLLDVQSAWTEHQVYKPTHRQVEWRVLRRTAGHVQACSAKTSVSSAACAERSRNAAQAASASSALASASARLPPPVSLAAACRSASMWSTRLHAKGPPLSTTRKKLCACPSAAARRRKPHQISAENVLRRTQAARGGTRCAGGRSYAQRRSPAACNTHNKVFRLSNKP